MVENDTSSVEYQLSTSTGPFSIPFYFIENGHIVAELYTQNGDDFNKTTLNINVDYYLNGAGDKNGGQLTLLSAHSGATLLIYRDPDATQLTSYLATGKFPATSHERALDKLTMLIQKFGWRWDSLALKKPNIFANFYDALNNRIRNLRDPSLAQDAATKSYVDSSDIDLQQQITSNFNRSLRVPDSYISQLPSAENRAWKGLGFDGAGQPKLQDPAGTGLWGYVPAVGSFEQGSLLSQRFEVLLWESTDEYWRWDGVMPKVVLPGSTPATAGGTGKGKWIDVTDATLRANLGSGDGLKLVGQCSDLTALRTIEPTNSNQRISVAAHSPGWAALTGAPVGGGEFYYDPHDTTSADDDIFIFVTDGGKRWKRACSGKKICLEWKGVRPGDDAAPALNAIGTYLNNRAIAKGTVSGLPRVHVGAGVYPLSDTVNLTYAFRIKAIGNVEFTALDWDSTVAKDIFTIANPANMPAVPDKGYASRDPWLNGSEGTILITGPVYDAAVTNNVVGVGVGNLVTGRTPVRGNVLDGVSIRHCGSAIYLRMRRLYLTSFGDAANLLI
ncbi:hypothetical protein POX81_09800 [Klebsiella pneumoniae]